MPERIYSKISELAQLRKEKGEKNASIAKICVEAVEQFFRDNGEESS